jgi:DNA-binding PadR family transcriptional regulator
LTELVNYCGVVAILHGSDTLHSMLKPSQKTLNVLLLDLEVRSLAFAEANEEKNLARQRCCYALVPVGSFTELERWEIHLENCRQALQRSTHTLFSFLALEN